MSTPAPTVEIIMLKTYGCLPKPNVKPHYFEHNEQSFQAVCVNENGAWLGWLFRITEPFYPDTYEAFRAVDIETNEPMAAPADWERHVTEITISPGSIDRAGLA